MKNNTKGFTLVELMVSVAMTGIIVAAVYSAFTLQQRTSTAQDQVVEMQQNIRAAMYTMMQEFRMAGYDPDSINDASITAASVSGITFEMTNDAGTVDTITYGFLPADDNDGNGIVNNADGIAALRRDINAGGLQPIAENIEAIEFQYSDEDGNPTVTPSDIHSITISILARAAWIDTKYFNNTVYTTASGVDWTFGPDNYRRRLFITSVQCRNMGI